MEQCGAMKVVIVLMLCAVLGALASAGFFMLRRRPEADEAGAPRPRDRRMARALALRIALSVALFVFILIAWALGWVRPGGLPVGL